MENKQELVKELKQIHIELDDLITEHYINGGVIPSHITNRIQELAQREKEIKILLGLVE